MESFRRVLLCKRRKPSNKLIKNVIKACYNSYFQAYLWHFCNPLIIFFSRCLSLLHCAYTWWWRVARPPYPHLAAMKWNSDELYRPTLPNPALADTKEIQTKIIEVEKLGKLFPSRSHVHNWTWKDEQLRGSERKAKEKNENIYLYRYEACRRAVWANFHH